jgi:hypothetical protein
MAENRGGEVRPLISFDEVGLQDVVFVSRYDTISEEDFYNHRVWIWEDCNEAISHFVFLEILYEYDMKYFANAVLRAKNSGVSTLFTGSSYGLHGIDTAQIGDDVNISMHGQDIYYTAKVLYDVCEYNHNVKNIVVCCDYYFFNEDLSALSAEDHQLIVRKTYEKLYGDIHNRSVLSSGYSYLPKSDVFDVDKIFQIYSLSFFKNDYFHEKHTRKEAVSDGVIWSGRSEEEKVQSGKNRAKAYNKWYKWKYTYNENIGILNELCDFCANRGINLLFVVTPKSEIYREYIRPEFKPAFYEALENAPGEIHVLDLYDSSEYSDSDFVDSDHLGDSGAEKLTKAILATLHEINEAKG